MKLIQYHSDTNAFTEQKLRGRLDISKGDQLIVISSRSKEQESMKICLGKSKPDNIHLTKEEIGRLIQYCGYPSLKKQIVQIYTPRLFLLEQHKRRGKRLLLKLGSICLVAENQQIREISMLDFAQSYGKYFVQENILAWEES